MSHPIYENRCSETGDAIIMELSARLYEIAKAPKKTISTLIRKKICAICKKISHHNHLSVK